MSRERSNRFDAASVLCFNVDEQGSCSVNILEGDSWIEVVARGITASTLSNDAVAELVAPLITEIVGTVGSAPSPSAVWVAPSSTGVLPEDCSTYATAGEFQALFTTAEDIVMGSGNDGEAWGIDNASWTMADVHRCTWAAANTGQTWPLFVTSLPGGEWAYERSAGVMTGEGSSERVAGTMAGVDAATFGCHVYSGFCSLDVVVAGNWIQYNAEQALLGSEDDVRVALRDLAERAVARFPAYGFAQLPRP